MPKADDNVRGPLLETVCSAIVEDTDVTQEAASDNGLLELGNYLSPEFLQNVKYGYRLIKRKWLKLSD